jgi:hypothetical protein
MSARPLELLHRRAEMLDATVVIRSPNDIIDETTGNRPYSRLTGDDLCELAVVRPVKTRMYSRSMQIQRGFVLASAPLATHGRSTRSRCSWWRRSTVTSSRRGRRRWHARATRPRLRRSSANVRIPDGRSRGRSRPAWTRQLVCSSPVSRRVGRDEIRARSRRCARDADAERSARERDTTLPELAIGTIAVRDVTYVRLGHLLDWLDEITDRNPDAEVDVDEIRRALERLGR